MSSAIDQFRSAIVGAGLVPPDEIHDDGLLHRFSTSGKRQDLSGWYCLHSDGVPAGAFGCWRAGVQSAWCAKSDSAMTPAEREAHRKRVADIQAWREQALLQRQEAAATTAAAQWAQAALADDHPYLARKGIKPHGARVFGENLLIPLRDTDGQLHSLQTIAPDGTKRFQSGGRTKGCFHLIGEPTSTLVITEGFATGASIHEATGHAVACAMNAGNLLEVAQVLRGKYPKLEIIVAADDDHITEGNPGLTKATEAAKAVGGKLAVPVFGPDRPEGATDFNDLHQLAGADAVRQCFDAAPAESASSKVPGMDARPAYVVFDDWYETPGSERYKPGVWLFGTKTEGKGENATVVPTQTWICSPLHVVAGTSDAHDGSYGRLLRFKNTRGNWRDWAMPMHMLAGDGTSLCEVLFSLGMLIGSKPALTRYLQAMVPPKDSYLLCVSQPGWADSRCRAFALPDGAIGPDAARVVFQNGGAGDSDFGTAGTLQGWQAGIGAMAVGNPMLALAICTAFAGPLLAKCNAESGGPHLIGPSSVGKSSALAAASSVWGSPSYKRTWRATSNGLESVAAGVNDCLLALDEISECDPKDVGPTVYMVGNGMGKQRAGRDGGFRNVARWRVSVLSNGEFSIGTSMAAGGHVIKAGQEVRFFDVPCGDRAHGVWDVLHHHADARAFSDAIKDAAKTHYGHAARAFVERLANDTTDFCAALAAIRARPELATNGEGQEQRVAGRFAVLALAGELASSYGITTWPAGEAIRAAAAGLQAWRSLQADKDGANRERGKAVQDVTDFIDRHGDSRFSDADALPDEALRQPLIHNRAGYWRQTDAGRVYLFNSAGMREALKGHDFGRALGYLQQAGLMPPTGSDGKNSKALTIQGKRGRWYEVRQRGDA